MPDFKVEAWSEQVLQASIFSNIKYFKIYILFFYLFFNFIHLNIKSLTLVIYPIEHAMRASKRLITTV